MAELKEGELTLESLDDGYFILQANEELKEVIANVHAEGTAAKTKRKLTLEIEIVPSEERTRGRLTYKFKKSLAPRIEREANIYMTRLSTGEIVASEHTAKDRPLPLMDQQPEPLQMRPVLRQVA